NLGPRLHLERTRAGEFIVDINAFWREVDNQIMPLGNERYETYQNVYEARGRGLENVASWFSPRRYVFLHGQLTWEDFRNISRRGNFSNTTGDRMPHRPYLFGSWIARLRFAGLPGPSDTVEPYYYGRYVHEFFRGWESLGLLDSKAVVPSQVQHTVGVTWTVHNQFARVSSTLEVDNLTDAVLMDNYNVQRPRRGVYVKLTAETL
ncbi:MAG TPA: ligand-gated channel protein, partial [Polyangiaceae bacterium]|nr:ligand-gated channel protein [Polyangiaceae bacterium]